MVRKLSKAIMNYHSLVENKVEHFS